MKYVINKYKWIIINISVIIFSLLANEDDEDDVKITTGSTLFVLFIFFKIIDSIGDAVIDKMAKEKEYGTCSPTSWVLSFSNRVETDLKK